MNGTFKFYSNKNLDVRNVKKKNLKKNEKLIKIVKQNGVK